MSARDRTACDRRQAILRRVVAAICCSVLVAAPAPTSGSQNAGSRLVVTVQDPSGAMVPDAEVMVTARMEDGAAGEPAAASAAPSAPGVSILHGLRPGRYSVRVSAPGFETGEVPVGVTGRETRLTVKLSIARVTESIEVERDPQSAALDPRGFSTFLSREQIEALPDDPVDFARALQDLAPPGAVLRIDGFTGGLLPPKSQILSIRIPRLDTFAAQDHGGLSGLSFIDIVTRPGGGRLRGGADVGLRDAAFNARNPLSRDHGRESVRAVSVALDGPVVRDRISFSLSARGAVQRDTATIRAVVPGAMVHSDAIGRPQETFTISGRVAAALPADQTARISFSAERRSSRNLGVGDYNLAERAYRTTSSDGAVRAVVGGPVGRRAFIDSRVQARWTGLRASADVEAPTIRVLDAFTSGGAQVGGGARAFELLAAADVDYARGAHAWRAGILVETGRYQAARRSNYLGTFTFASLDDYVAARPATFTQRVGDGRIRYRNGQAGVYLQDDVRVARSLLISYGLRYELQTLVTGWGVILPRAGLTWSPFRTGRTTLRAGWGRFSDWLAAETYEHSLAIDGLRQYDIRIQNPEYPTPGRPGDQQPRERYLLAGDLRLPAAMAASVGLEHLWRPTVRLYASYGHRTGRHLLRGRNLNAPIAGRRPDPSFANVIQAGNGGRSRTPTVTAQIIRSHPQGRFDLSGAYAFNGSRSDTTGPYGLPADERALDAEWGPATPAHTATAALTIRAGRLTLSLTPRWRSGIPYSITTGRDDNGDGLFTDRPAGAVRNGERTSAHWDLGGRVSYVLRFGAAALPDPGIPSAGADVQSTRAGAIAGRVGADAADLRRYRIEFFASAQNVTNRPEYIAVGGVQGSPFFGQPVLAGSPRRIDVGVRVGF